MELFRKKSKKIIPIISIFMFSILIQTALVAGSYSISLNTEDAWYSGWKGDNAWGESNYRAFQNEYELKAWDYLWFDGYAWIDFCTLEGEDAFTPSEDGYATVRIKWVLNGELYTSGGGYLRFTYNFRNSNNQIIYDIGVKTYSSDQVFDNDLEYHEFTTPYLGEGVDYYVYCHIYLQNGGGLTSNFLDSGDRGMELLGMQLWH